MTYQIYYLPKEESEGSRGYTLFDIEYYQKPCEKSGNWYSEISCLPIVEGIALFIKDSVGNKNFDFKEFLRDAHEIQEVRGLLYEYYNNKPRPSDDANDFHYHVFGKALEVMINEFSKKYGLFVNRD